MRDSAGPREKKRVQSKRLKATLLTPVVAARFAGFAAHAADRQRPRAARRGGVSRKHRDVARF